MGLLNYNCSINVTFNMLIAEATFFFFNSKKKIFFAIFKIFILLFYTAGY